MPAFAHHSLLKRLMRSIYLNRIDIPPRVPILVAHPHPMGGDHKYTLFPSKTISNVRLSNRQKKLNISWTDDIMLVKIASKIGKSKNKRTHLPLHSMFTSVNSSISSYEEKSMTHGNSNMRKG
jgi:hypothetical protein